MTRRLALLVVLAAALAGLSAPSLAAAPPSCRACGIVEDNLRIGWQAANAYASTHGGRLPTGRAWVNAVLDATAGLDPGIGGLAKARRLDDPAAVLIDPRSTGAHIILWGRAANGVVVSLTGHRGGRIVFHFGG